MNNYSKLNKKLKLKYILDRVFAYPVLFFVSPLILLCIWAIKIDGWFNPKNSGSVFYTEPRISAGKIFNIIKFRTVSKDLVDWIKQAPEQRSQTGRLSRTSAGKLIITWYLDELPQLFNIIKGEMSFVGPRPHIISQHNEEIKRGWLYRNILKAGILGVPQSCKGDPKYAALLATMVRRRKLTNKALDTLDGIYVKKCSSVNKWGILVFDLKIIARCLVVVLRGGACV